MRACCRTASPPRVGALMEPLANGVHAVRLAPDGVESAVVVGAGTIGLVTLQAALLDGILHVAVVEPQDERRARASRSARTRLRTPRRPRTRASRTSCSMPSAPRLRAALGLELLRPGGTLVCIGLA